MEPFPFPSMVLPGTQARRKGVKKLPEYYCYVSTLNNNEADKAYTYRAFRVKVPKRFLKKAKKEGSPKAWVTFRYGSRNALSRTEADTGAIAPGGLVRVARCLIPESKKIAALLNEQFTKFGNKSWVSQSKSKQLQDNKGDAPPTAPNMVVECADWYSNCLDDGSGMCDDPDNWHTECAYYTWVNQGGGSDDGGGPGDGNSGPTGGGSTSGGNGGTGNGDDADPCLHGVYGCEPCEMPNPPASCQNSAEVFENKINYSDLKPCMVDEMNALLTIDVGVGEILQDFGIDGVIPEQTLLNLNWKVKDGDLPAGRFGRTYKYNTLTKTAFTKIDTDKFGNASRFGVAQVLVHEAVHAFLLAAFYHNPIDAEKTYAELYEQWLKTKDLNESHHMEMAKNFIHDLAVTLQQFGNDLGLDNIPFQYYKDLAWGGLMGTPYFSNLSQEDQQRIKDVVSTELTNRDADGDYRSPKADDSGC